MQLTLPLRTRRPMPPPPPSKRVEEAYVPACADCNGNTSWVRGMWRCPDCEARE